ncbi:MAG: arylamine N-acetyltransferase [Chloroflexota bacterium]|nr:arylamine N-acetyltransferase [Chloroflexota bacterium]
MGEATAFDTAAYLTRIGFVGDAPPTRRTLRNLHLAHLRSVPFEDLDVHLKRPIRLDEAALFDKIVRRRRGGFCYELNGLFSALLRALGFGVDLLAGQFPREDGRTAPRFDHLALAVRVPGEDGAWLADVGAGRDSPARPLPLTTGAEAWQPEAGARFRLTAEDGALRLWRREPGGEWERRYRFTPQPHPLADFEEGCRFHQTSPDSGFTSGRICSLATPAGRVTLSDRRLIVSEGSARTERELPDEAAWRATLRDRFGIELDR